MAVPTNSEFQRMLDQAQKDQYNQGMSNMAGGNSYHGHALGAIQGAFGVYAQQAQMQNAASNRKIEYATFDNRWQVLLEKWGDTCGAVTVRDLEEVVQVRPLKELAIEYMTGREAGERRSFVDPDAIAAMIGFAVAHGWKAPE